MTAAGSSQWALNLVTRYAQASGLTTTGAVVLHHYSNAVVLLPAEDLIVRLAPGAHAVSRIATSQAVCRWLLEVHDFPTTQPAPGLAPVALAGLVTMSFWRYHRPPEHSPPFSSADLADLLRRLHQLGAPPFPILPWRPLTTLSSTLDNRVAASVLSSNEIGWLRDRVQAVRDALFRISWPLGAGLIHGDAWLGNLLAEHRPSGPVLRLGDWDDVAIGPREIDLIPTWHASYRYGRGPAWRAAFRDRYGHDLEAWDGFGVLMDMRDLVQLSGPIRRAANSAPHAAALRQRVRDLRTVSTATVWTAL